MNSAGYTHVLNGKVTVNINISSLTGISLTIAIILLIPSTAPADFQWGSFTDDRTVVFAEDAVLYSAPDVHSSAVVQLPVGADFEITGSAGEEYSDDGITSCWYEATYGNGDDEYTGYIPGSDIAMSNLKLGGDTLFIFTSSGFNEEEQYFILSARIVSSGEILAELDFRPPGSSFGEDPYRCCIGNTELRPNGLAGVKNLFEISFIYSFCGYAKCDMLMVWTGSDLIPGPEVRSQTEIGIYQYISEYVLPSDSSGVVNEMTVRGTFSEWDEDLEDYVTMETTMITYEWDGEKFIEPGEEP